ncbi:hypothetical protein Tco_1416737, partial [Tanacetum coccineum]
MPIPNELISNNIRNAPYYNAYLEMVSNHDQKVAAKKEGKNKYVSTKQPKPKPAIEKSSKPAPAPKPKLVDEPDEEPAHSEPEPEPEQEGSGEEYDMERAIQMKAIRPLPVVEGNGKAIVTEEQAAQSLLALHTPKRRSTTNQFILERQTSATEKVSTRPSAQPQDDTSTNIIAKELGEDVTNQVNLEEKTAELDQDQAGSDPGESLESRAQPEQVHMDEDQAGPYPGINRVALDGLDPDPTYDEFMADLYPKVQESLKFPVDEHVILEDHLSSTGTLSSMKNLEDAYAIGDKFINDKSTDDELGKLNVEAEVVSMFTAPIYQAVYTLELKDMPHKINEAIHENVKEAVQIALRAPLRDRFRDLSEEDMKEMLHQRMFEIGSYKSLLEHIALYEALKASMERAQRDEFLAEKDKSRKRRHDDQDPSPPPPDSDLNAPLSSSKQQFGPYAEQPVEDIPIQDSDNISDSVDTDFAYLPKTKIDISKPLPLSGPPGHVTIQTQFFFNKDLDYLHYGSKGSGQPFSIFKMKAARYHDFGLELLVPKHMWIDDVCTYDISASYAYSRYGYDYLKEIILRRADHQEYTIAKYDFKNLYHSDFKDLNLLLLQGHLNHLPDSDIRMLSTAV